MVLNVKMKTNAKVLSANIRRYGSKLTAKQRNNIIIWSNIVRKEAKSNLRESRRTGRLEDSIGEPTKEGVFHVSPKGYSVTIGTKVPYALHVEYGVKPRISKTEKVMRFRDTRGGKEGKWYAKKKVKGFKGKHFMAHAFNEANRKVKYELKQPIRI